MFQLEFNVTIIEQQQIKQTKQIKLFLQRNIFLLNLTTLSVNDPLKQL